MDILDIFDEATKEATAFENHPGKNLPLEERLLYLQALAMLMNVDGDMHSTEEEYLKMLIQSFDLDESNMDTLLTFAKIPDKDTIKAFVSAFRRRPIAQLFLFDALMLIHRDGNVNEREQLLVDKISQQLEVLKGTYKDINDLFGFIQNKNWQESAVYFNTHLLNPEHFKHLLSYYEMDFDQLMKETRSQSKFRLLDMIRAKTKPFLADITWVPLQYDGNYEHPTATEITSKIIPGININDIFSHDLILPFIQSQLDRGLVRVLENTVFKNDAIYCDLNHLDLLYNNVTHAFYANPQPLADAAYSDEDIPLLDDFLGMVLDKDVDLSRPDNINHCLQVLLGGTMVESLSGQQYLPSLIKPGEIILGNLLAALWSDELEEFEDRGKLQDELNFCKTKKVESHPIRMFMAHSFNNHSTALSHDFLTTSVIKVLSDGNFRLIR